MNRVAQAQTEAVREALDHIPRRLHEYLGHDLFCSDPIFAGIFAPPWDNESMADGRSYRRVAHVGWPYHTKDGRTTLVWPSLDEAPHIALYVAVHELGHVLHGHLADRVGWSKMPFFWNVTKYAKTDYFECFAEAFAAWVLYSPEQMDDDPYWPWGYSRPNAEWFDRLAAA